MPLLRLQPAARDLQQAAGGETAAQVLWDQRARTATPGFGAGVSPSREDVDSLLLRLLSIAEV